LKPAGAAAVVTMPVEHRTDAMVAASWARRFGAHHGLAEPDAQALTVIVAELASNVVDHGGGGVLSIACARSGFEVEAVDRGTGLDADPDALRSGALAHHYVDDRGLPRPGLGRGLDAVRRLSTQLSAERTAAGGLRVVARRRRDAPP
jgi:anti-sigma regulatory factor (Ser/Thr protein kinase)